MLKVFFQCEKSQKALDSSPNKGGSRYFSLIIDYLN